LYLTAELEQFQKSDDGKLQGPKDYKDTKMVAEMLHAQSELKHKIEDYVEAHHEHTFDMSDV
jgi:hypothetical protein